MYVPILQFNMAKLIPGKEEFHETIRYFKTRLALLGVDVRLGARVTAVSAFLCLSVCDVDVRPTPPMQ